MGGLIQNIEKETEATSEFNFSEIPGMNWGKMFKLSEVLSNYIGNSYGLIGQNSNMYYNMMSALYENESRKSSIGLSVIGNERLKMSSYGSSLNFGKSVIVQPSVEKAILITKETLSEVRKISKLSQLSEVGSDDYRNDIIKNEYLISDYIPRSLNSLSID